MSRWEAWSLHILTIVVSVSGVVYFWMKYLLRTEDPFAVVNHPLQPAMLKTHILASPLLILAVGVILSSHVIKKLQDKNAKSSRFSGLISLVSFLLMVLSGYLIQISTNPTFSRFALLLHLVSGGLFAAAYLAHYVFSMFLAKNHWNSLGKSRLAA